MTVFNTGASVYTAHPSSTDSTISRWSIRSPDPGRPAMGALLDPLADHPELMHTLRVHLGNHLNLE